MQDNRNTLIVIRKYQSDRDLVTQAFNNLIKFPLTPEFISYWGQSAIAPRIKNNYLELRIARADYALVTSGDGISTKKGYSSVYGEKERKIIGFRARVRSQSEDLYLAMIELANYTAGSGCNLVPIEKEQIAQQVEVAVSNTMSDFFASLDQNLT